MKRLLLTLSLAACFIGSSSFANDNIAPEALKSFYQTFSKAENVSWTEADGMLRIGFTLNGQLHFAYYSDNELVVVATEIKTDELPAQMKNALTKYNGYTVSQAYVLEKNKTKEYCVVMNNGSHQIVLKGKHKWNTYLEEKK